jgi:DeoR/GlpR family transcriptional regulator of sugar metabolism
VTEHCLELFSADIAFQGADGIGLDGSIYNSDLRLAHVDRMMRRVARRSCLVADHSKIGRTALAQSGSMADVDFFITSAGVPPEALKRFARLGAKVITAPRSSSA